MCNICVICKIKYNVEELAECIKCKEPVCQDCLVFEDGNYYCCDCADIENKNTEK